VGEVAAAVGIVNGTVTTEVTALPGTTKVTKVEAELTTIGTGATMTVEEGTATGNTATTTGTEAAEITSTVVNRATGILGIGTVVAQVKMEESMAYVDIDVVPATGSTEIGILVGISIPTERGTVMKVMTGAAVDRDGQGRMTETRVRTKLFFFHHRICILPMKPFHHFSINFRVIISTSLGSKRQRTDNRKKSPSRSPNESNGASSSSGAPREEHNEGSGSQTIPEPPQTRPPRERLPEAEFKEMVKERRRKEREDEINSYDNVVTRPEPEAIFSKQGSFGPGTRPVSLVANFYKLRTIVEHSTWTLQNYHVYFDPEEELTHVKKALVKTHATKLRGYIFNGTNLYTPHRIPDEVTC